MKCRIILLVLLTGLILTAGEKVIHLSADKELVKIESRGEFDLISYPEGLKTGKPGFPGLPQVPISVVMPSGAENVKIEEVKAKWESLSGFYYPYPYQPVVPIGAVIDEVEPDEDEYTSSEWFPGHSVEIKTTGNLGGFKITTLLFSPLRFNAEKRILEVAGNVEVVLSYGEGICSFSKSFDKIEKFAELVRSFVLNPDDVDKYRPELRESRGSLLLPPGDYREVMITSSELVSSVEPLNEWRTKTGVRCTTLVASDIVSQYPGWDAPEKLRNFIIDADSTWGTLYFTMVGDSTVIPYRNIVDSTAGYMPCDHYFADLTGTWDSDGDHLYGETHDDTLDLFSDVFVGRLSVESQFECSTVVSRILTYEKNPPSGYIEEILLPAVELWPDYWGDYINDSIANFTPGGFQDNKLYQSMNNLTHQGVVDEVNDGVGFAHYSAHGNQNGTYWAGGVDTVFHSNDVLGLTSGNKLGIHNSIACIPGAYDVNDTWDPPPVSGDCMAEHLLNYPGGGASGVIMNVRVGLGTPPTMGPSEKLSLEFYRKAFVEDVHRIGPAHFISKDVYVHSSPEMDFCIAELTLFGDPAMPMWLAEPDNQSVSHPDTIPLGSQTFQVNITDGSSPIEDALVCIMSKKGEIYDYDYTDASGYVNFQINPTMPDTMWVTSTALNFIPYEGYSIIKNTSFIPEGEVKDDVMRLVMPSMMTDEISISYMTPENGRVVLDLISLDGRIIGNIVDEFQNKGVHELKWKGEIKQERLSNGIYFLRLKNGTENCFKKLVIMR